MKNYLVKSNTLLVYLLSGLVGSIFSYALSPNPAAGASGAIFGLMGSLLYFRKRKRRLFYRIFGSGLLFIIGINLFYGFVQPGIDNWGHIGGLIGGYLVANALGLYKDRRVDIDKLLAWLLLIAVILLGLRYGNYKYGRAIYLEYTYFARPQILGYNQYYGNALEDYLELAEAEQYSVEAWFYTV